MPYLQWDESYAVGVAEIDAQHRRLFELVDSLHHACESACSPGELMRAVEEFAEYTRHHFATEEQYMDEYEYAGREAHIEEHMLCSMKAVEFFGQGVVGDPELPRRLLDYLADWLVRHVRGTDRGLGQFLNRRGLA